MDKAVSTVRALRRVTADASAAAASVDAQAALRLASQTLALMMDRVVAAASPAHLVRPRELVCVCLCACEGLGVCERESVEGDPDGRCGSDAIPA
jgi:hypothetical protein